MTELIFSRNLTGQNQVQPFVDQLIQRDADLGLLLIQGFSDLKEAPEGMFPLGKTEPYRVNRIRNGREVTIELAKRLSEPQIFEMKADYKKEYHRFIYFPYYYNGENCYVFVYGFTKVHGKPDLTNHFMSKTKELYDYLSRTGNEEKYFEG